MIYILCEDSGAGFNFYRKISNIYATESRCKVIPSNGNGNYKKELRKIKYLLQKDDTLILTFDNIETRNSFNSKNILDNAKLICENKKVRLYYTTYYCFEEIFLAYAYLNYMFYKGSYHYEDKNIWIKLLNYIYISLQNETEYYTKNNSLVEYAKSKINKANKNKENFAKAVLTYISGSIRGDFKIHGSNLGKCWLENCGSINMPNKEYRCNNCIARFKYLDSEYKLDELMRYSLPLFKDSLANIFNDDINR